MTPRHALLAVLGLWLLSVAVVLSMRWDNLVALNFIDPDDALRLVEVRDWLAGQSWFDVTQYRINPPVGGPMHWSRLVDIPIAACIRLLSLFVEQGLAERLALCIVPFSLLLALFLTLHRLTVRVSGRQAVSVAAAAMLATSVSVLIQFQALRIDHHGWQILLGTLAVLLLLALRERDAAGGLWPGLVMAFSLIVALESLPLAMLLGGVLALRYLIRAEAWAGIAAYLAALAGGGALLLLATLGWRRGLVPWCDSLSPAYILPLAATAAILLAARLVPQRQAWQRLLALGAAGAAGAATFQTA
ncbi:MAG: hypothetical protein QM690_21840, partial [Sphingobium sp.]